MAKEFGMLPHQVEQNATTYDLMVLDIVNTYDKYLENKQKGVPDPSTYDFTTEELLQMVNKNAKH